RDPFAMSPSVMISHQAMAYEIAFQLRQAIEECERCMVLGEEDWKLSGDTVLKPDVVMICDEPNDAYITKAPEIIIEVISKTTAKWDEKIKFEIYEKENVKYYVIIYPDDLKAKVYRLKEGRYDKQGDFSKECYDFTDTLCPVSIDFAKVFKRFRK
ncbi:MAG: Uma2 family endonuclease, partial [Epsilonproteobacteria bacterium]|nr:Uma2 family endonuclease [Campylobacterota bacterium]